MFKKIIVSLLLGLVFTAEALAQNVDYYLPYPGILPDHPLYWLKMVRDRAQLILTTKLQAKADKLLLYADKRLGAAWALIDGNKVPLGVSTLTKGEKYLDQVIAQRDNFSDQGRLDRAIKKHLEVLALVKDKTGSYANLVGDMIAKLEAVKLPAQAVPVSILVDFGIEATEETPVEVATVFEALEKVGLDQDWEIITKDYDFGKLVESINGVKSDPKMTWIYYVNGQAGDKASDRFELKAGDKVEWRYEKVKP